MNYRKKYFIKNGILMASIILIAIISTYKIYNKFNLERHVNYSSSSLDIVFHEKEGAQVSITKVTPVVDAIGLSSRGYSFTITNNLTIPVKFKVKIIEDKLKISEDKCQYKLIDESEIRLSINSKNQEDDIVNLSDLEDGTIHEFTIDALDSDDYTIRVWIKNDSNLVSGSNMHYHGIIQIVEEDNSVAQKEEEQIEEEIEENDEK